jgi:hypothetical protein
MSRCTRLNLEGMASAGKGMNSLRRWLLSGCFAEEVKWQCGREQERPRNAISEKSEPKASSNGKPPNSRSGRCGVAHIVGVTSLAAENASNGEEAGRKKPTS